MAIKGPNPPEIGWQIFSRVLKIFLWFFVQEKAEGPYFSNPQFFSPSTSFLPLFTSFYPAFHNLYRCSTKNDEKYDFMGDYYQKS